MKRDRRPRPWWKDNWFAWVLAVLVLIALLITTILGYLQNWAWIGFGTKSVWDWLDLLINPLVLALVASWLNSQTKRSEQELASSERENEQRITEDRTQEDSLQRYFDRMSELVLDKELRESQQRDAVRAMAQA